MPYGGTLTDVDICNLALLNVGVAAKINALTDNTKEARAASSQYALTRDQLLSDPRRNWTFNRVRKILAASANPVRSGWSYIYTYPSGILCLRRLWNGMRICRPEQELPFATELDDAGTGLVVLCDVESTTTTPEMVCSKTVSPTLFPPYFIDALAWLLASKLVIPEMISSDMQQAAAKTAELWIARAIIADVGQERRDASSSVKDTFTASRGRMGTGLNAPTG